MMQQDMMDYPPMISLIDILHDLGENVIYIGAYTESPTTARFENSGIQLIKLTYPRTGNILQKILNNRRYKNNLDQILSGLRIYENDIVWYIYSETANFVHKILKKYNYLVHFYEYPKAKCNWKYRLMYPSFNQKVLAQNAVGIVQCEYNRAQIYRALNELEKSPFVLPNKPYTSNNAIENTPENIKKIIQTVKDRVRGKRVVLYQGYFESKQRKLEEFCEAINKMNSNYVMIAMGKGPEGYFDQLKKKYESEKIVFIPFIIPPFHLQITELASIGVLTYSPSYLAHEGVINVLYCAPNKIFEYSRYGKPMIANNVPGLKYIFQEYHCGAILDYPITSESIIEVLEKIFDNYSEYSEGAYKYYNSVDLQIIVKNILSELFR